MHVKIGPAEDPAAEAYDTLVGLFRKIQAVDRRLTIYPWRWTEAVGPTPQVRSLTEADQLPRDVRELKKYFPGLRFDKAEGGKSYMSVMLGHEQPLKVIMS